jgi:hypothetical protein
MKKLNMLKDETSENIRTEPSNEAEQESRSHVPVPSAAQQIGITSSSIDTPISLNAPKQPTASLGSYLMQNMFMYDASYHDHVSNQVDIAVTLGSV